MSEAGRGRVGILISGRGSNMVSLVEAMKAGTIDAEPAVVLSNRADAAGLERAAGFGVPTEVVPTRGLKRRTHETRVVETLKGYDVDLICLAGYMRLLSGEMVAQFPNRIMNIHPALLPSFPGLHVQQAALDYGAKVSGCTVHFVDDKCDHGPIIIQATVSILEDDTAETLSARILAQEHRIYPEAVRLFFQGRLSVEGRCVRVAPAATV